MLGQLFFTTDSRPLLKRAPLVSFVPTLANRNLRQDERGTEGPRSPIPCHFPYFSSRSSRGTKRDEERATPSFFSPPGVLAAEKKERNVSPRIFSMDKDYSKRNPIDRISYAFRTRPSTISRKPPYPMEIYDSHPSSNPFYSKYALTFFISTGSGKFGSTALSSITRRRMKNAIWRGGDVSRKLKCPSSNISN